MAAISCDDSIEDDLRMSPGEYPEAALDISMDELLAGDTMAEVMPDGSIGSPDDCLRPILTGAAAMNCLNPGLLDMDVVMWCLIHTSHSAAVSLYPTTMYHKNTSNIANDGKDCQRL